MHHPLYTKRGKSLSYEFRMHYVKRRHVAGHSFGDEVYGYRKYTSAGELTEGIVNLWEKELIPALDGGLCASIYTQVSDVEEEVNGIVTYDRMVTKVDRERLREANRRLRERFLANQKDNQQGGQSGNGSATADQKKAY